MRRNVVVLLNDKEGRELVRRKCRAAGVKMATLAACRTEGFWAGGADRAVASGADKRGQRQLPHR